MCQLRLHLPVSALAFASGLFRPLQISQIEDVGHALVWLAFECRRANKNRHAAAILSEILLFASLHSAGCLKLFEFAPGVHLLPFGRSHVEPSKASVQIL